MSRIGKKPVNVPSNVKVSLKGNLITCTGPKGAVSKKLPEGVLISMADSLIKVEAKNESRQNNDNVKFTGLTRTIIANIIEGVTAGFVKELEIIGVGYKAEINNKILNLSLGYSHPINFIIPEGISITVEKTGILKISGCDKELVGLVAARIRGLRKPEPYKGKGIKYSGEAIKRKVGKTSGK